MAEISSERIAELKARVKAECLRRCHIDSVESYGGEKYDFSRDPEKDNVAIEEHAEKILTPLNAIISAEKVADWDSKAAGNHEHDITELKQASGYVVFNCGNASINI